MRSRERLFPLDTALRHAIKENFREGWSTSTKHTLDPLYWRQPGGGWQSSASTNEGMRQTSLSTSLTPTPSLATPSSPSDMGRTETVQPQKAPRWAMPSVRNPMLQSLHTGDFLQAVMKMKWENADIISTPYLVGYLQQQQQQRGSHWPWSRRGWWTSQVTRSKAGSGWHLSWGPGELEGRARLPSGKRFAHIISKERTEHLYLIYANKILTSPHSCPVHNH